MYLLVPSSYKQLLNRANWFKKPMARDLAFQKNVDFGFELKGEPETVLEAPPLFWGYHLPNYFASQWYYHPENRKKLFDRLAKVVELKPNYINLHCIHLWRKPLASKYVQRYVNLSDSDDYLKILDANVELVNDIKKAFPETRFTVENDSMCGYYFMEDLKKYKPATYLLAGAGWLKDLLYLKAKTNVELLVDIEHLILTLNFLNREQNYAKIPLEKLEDISEITQKLHEIYGFYIKKDMIPYAEPKVEIQDIVPQTGAKIYHLTGSIRDMKPGQQILTHEPIFPRDKVFRHHLRLVLNQKPEALLIETADSSIAGFGWLRPNELENSFSNLCEILIEEL